MVAGLSDDDLAKQLTFDDAGSTDDLEIASSALAIQRYYQRQGYFDAAVALSHERKPGQGDDQPVDLVTFQIDPGQRRVVREVDIAGEHAVPEADLRAVLATKAAGASFALIGGELTVTRDELDADVARIVALYHQRGYLETKVTASASPVATSLGDAATTAAVLGAEEHASDLYVRFDVVEGEPTVVEHVLVDWKGAHDATDDEVRSHLAITDGAPYQLSALQSAGQRVQDWFGHIGRPRAQVKLDVTTRDPHHLTATYHIEEREEVRIGEVVVRGNFRTDQWVVIDELGFTRGALLTDDLYARGVDRLRATGLFSTVRVETAPSSRTRARPTPTWWCTLRSATTSGSTSTSRAGTPTSSRSTAAARSPRPTSSTTAPRSAWPARSASSSSRSTCRRRSPAGRPAAPTCPSRPTSSPRSSTGARTPIASASSPRTALTDALSRVWQRPRSDAHPARSIAATVRLDFRVRSARRTRCRPIGPFSDTTQAPVRTRTGSIGLTLVYDRRLDARGNLNPLIPDHGFKLEAGGLFATPYLYGQDTFFKINTTGQWIHTVKDRLQLHMDGTLDEGFPLGGAVLLPEVERFFAGGDTTVRGYAEDRLATEMIEIGVPPFGGVEQIRVMPAGGNIRVLFCVDAQVRCGSVRSRSPCSSTPA